MTFPGRFWKRYDRGFHLNDGEPMVQRFCLIPPVLAGIVLSSIAIASAQVPLLKPCGGAIGKPIKFEVAGGPASLHWVLAAEVGRLIGAPRSNVRGYLRVGTKRPSALDGLVLCEAGGE